MVQEPKGRPVQLHVIHDLGGGAVKWVRDFALADAERTNLVLRSFSHGRDAGSGLASSTTTISWAAGRAAASTLARQARVSGSPR